MHAPHHHLPHLHKPKPISGERAAAAVLLEHLNNWVATKWAPAAVARGSVDAAAQHEAAKSLLQLMNHLSHHRSICRRGEVRTHLQKRVPAALVRALLASSDGATLGLTLQSLAEASRLLPALVPTDTIPRLLELLCCEAHGAAAAKLLLLQLSSWRFSQLWPHWTAANATAGVCEQLQQLARGGLDAPSSSKAVEACVSRLALLARLMELSEQQVAQQLAGSVADADRCLQLLLHLGRQQASLAGSAASLQLQDNCCSLLAGLSRAPAVTVALEGSAQLAADLLRLLHRVLHKPCCVQEADAAHIRCWAHAATAASLPALWRRQQQQPGDAAAGHERDALLASLAVAAAGTLSSDCSSTSPAAKQLDAAAANLLAVALLPEPHVDYGTKAACVSRFAAAVINSDCVHTLLHALAAAADTNAGADAAEPSGLAAAADEAGAAGVTVIAQPQELQPAWLILRMLCAQCHAAQRVQGSSHDAAGTKASPGGSESDASDHHQQQQRCHGGGDGTGVEPAQLHRVVQAYSPCANQMQRLLGSLHVLMCQAVLPAQRQPPRQQRWMDAWLAENAAGGGSGAGSRGDANGSGGAGGDDSQLTTARLLLACMDTAHPAGGAPARSGRQVAWQLAAAAFVSLAVAVHLREAAGAAAVAAAAAAAGWAAAGASDAPAATATAHSVSADCALALCALRLAAAALKVLLPAAAGVAASGSSSMRAGTLSAVPVPGADASSSTKKQPHAQKPVVLQEALECSLAACAALTLLAQWVQPALADVLADVLAGTSTTTSSSSSSSHPAVPGFSVWSCRAAVADAAAALDGQLQQALAGFVTALSAECRSSRPGPASLRSVQAALQHSLQAEASCWAAAALAVAYGQLGAGGWQGAALAAYRQPDAPFADVCMLLGSRQLPGHAALLAAGCPVLGQQLLPQAAAPLAAGKLTLKLSAALDEGAVEGAVDYIYAGSAQLPEAGLAFQLQACSTCLADSKPLAAHSKPMAAQQLQQLVAVQQQAVQQLKDQQQAAQQRLQVLARLAKKLQLPLLAAAARGSTPQPGQQLHELHPRLEVLLPRQLLLCELQQPADDDGQQQQQQQQEEAVLDSAASTACVTPSGAGSHSSCSSYLSLLAAPIAAATSLAGVSAAALDAACLAGQQQQDSPHTLPWCSLADVLLAAPAEVVLTAHRDASPGAGSRRHDQGSTQEPLQPLQHLEQQERVAMALLPAHKAVLSGCPYFEVLLSERWQHDEASPSDSSSGSGRLLRVLAVPEADAHVAAALQQYLYTGRLQVCQLPAVVLQQPRGASSGAAQAQVQLCGCCTACHEARVLLRLWRCAELLLLPELQRLAQAAVEAAAWQQLSAGCCLALLADCWELGVPAAADGVAAALVARADKEAVAALPEWSALQASVHDTLLRAWSDAQQADADTALNAAGVLASSSGSDARTPWRGLLRQHHAEGLQQASAALLKLMRPPHTHAHTVL